MKPGIPIKKTVKELVALIRNNPKSLVWLPLHEIEKPEELRLAVYIDRVGVRDLPNLTEKGVRAFLWDFRNHDRNLRKDAAVWVCYNEGGQPIIGIGVALKPGETVPLTMSPEE